MVLQAADHADRFAKGCRCAAAVAAANALPPPPRPPPAALPCLPYHPSRCDKELAKLQQQVDLRAERLRREVGAEEAGYRARVAAMEAEWAGVRRGFGELEARMTGVTQAATKIGNRLQVSTAWRAPTGQEQPPWYSSRHARAVGRRLGAPRLCCSAVIVRLCHG